MTGTLPDCTEVLAGLKLIPATELSTFVVGSTARGWAHATSDVDVVVISDEPFVDDRAVTLELPLDPGSLPTVSFHHDGRRWEVKYWLDRQVDQLLGKVTWERLDEARTGDRLTEVELLFLSRLRTCATVTGREWVRRQRERLDGSAFRSVLIMQALTKSDDAAEVAIGQLAAGETECAVLSARLAFGFAVDALLAGHGEYEMNVKWRARRLRTVAPALLSFEDYWAVETMRDYRPEQPGRWVEQVVGFCKTVSLEVEM